jgi:hypothetical protein
MTITSSKYGQNMQRSLDAIASGILLAALLSSCAPSPPSKPTAPDFNGLWQVADSEYVRRPDVHAQQSEYTPQAWANLEAYRRDWDPEADDPAKFCSPGGMPHTILTRARDYVTEIHQYPREVILFSEYMDRARVIHLDLTAVPGAFVPSQEGFSIGRFDGDTLVIETTMLKARNAVDKLQRSEQARITERWTLNTDSVHGEVLDIDVTVVDPEVFRSAVKGRQKLRRAPAGTVRNEYDCPGSSWNDHVASKLEQRAAVAKGAKP